MLIGPMVTGAGSVQSGKFKGKMIIVESMMDQDALPWQADWYRSTVKEALGDRMDDSFRLWYVEHALHGDGARQGKHNAHGQLHTRSLSGTPGPQRLGGEGCS